MERITGVLVLDRYFDPYTFKIRTAPPHTPIVKDAILISFLGLSYPIQKTKLFKSMIDTFSFFVDRFSPLDKRHFLLSNSEKEVPLALGSGPQPESS